jgi:putative addiction module antidote
MIKLKLTTVGSSLGFILPTEARNRLDVRKGDTVYLTEEPGGAWRMTAEDPDFARQMSLAEDIMHDDRDILAALAKR